MLKKNVFYNEKTSTNPIKMNTINRSRCVIANTPDLEMLHIFPDFPVFMGATNQERSDDIMSDMVWSISKSSGAIQLASLIPLEDLYPASHGSGQVGNTWLSHHRAFATFINNFNPESVFEIGGGHGILSREYHALRNIPWTILEPNPTPAEGVNAKYKKGFFDSRYCYDGQYDAVAHSHVFEHTYEPDDFLRKIAGFMSSGMKLFFSVPNLPVMFKKKYCNSINFEHTFFYTEEMLFHLLTKNGFRILKQEYFLDDHSIFIAALRDPHVSILPLPQGAYSKHKELFYEYLSYYQNLVRDFNSSMLNNSNPIYLFGAHIFSQYLLNFGLKESSISAVLDNDSNKCDKRLYGTGLIIKSPEILRDQERAIIILRAGAYDQEIKEQILSRINPRVEFW